MKKFFLLSLLSVFVACGGSSGSDTALLTIESSSGAVMRGGDSMVLRVSTDGFDLQEPNGVTPLAGEQFVGGLVRLAHSAELDDHSSSDESEHGVGSMESESLQGEHVMPEHEVNQAVEQDNIHVHSDGSLHDHSAEGDGLDVTHGGGHSHGGTSTNPFATEGHMHIYLDAGMGAEPHITSWSIETPLRLPEDITPGTHSLRVELRDDNHTPLGQEHDQYFFFEVIE